MQVLRMCSLCGRYSINRMSDNENFKKEIEKFKNLKNLSSQFKDVSNVFNKLKEYNDLIDQIKHGNNKNNKNVKNMIQQSESVISLMLGKLNQKCDYCSERLILSGMEESVLEKYGYQLYEKYYNRMTRKGKPLPKTIKIKVVGEDTTYRGSCDYNEKLKMWVVEINVTEGYSKHDARVAFAHEFGHLLFDYDKETGAKNKNTSLWSSEYFAAEIEMREFLKYDDLNDEVIRVTDRLIYDNRTLILKDYLFDKLNSAMTDIKDKCDEGLNDMNIVSIIRSNLWYRSKINFVKKYLDESSIEFIPDANKIEKYLEQRYGIDDIDLCDLLKQANDNFVGDFTDIDSDLLTTIYHKIAFQLNSHIPGQEHFRSHHALLKHISGNNYNKEGI